jgi:O-antigen/teichoic acid export membrane protein
VTAHASITSVGAAVFTALTTFLLFRMGVIELGRDKLGCWALIQGFMIVARITDAGISSNITRLAAIRRTQSGGMSIGDFLCAGLLLAVTPVVVIGGAAVYPTALYLDERYSGSVSASDVLSMTLASYAYGVFGSLSGASLALIEGLGLIVYRNIITMLSCAAMAAVAWPLMHHWGATGLGLANLVMVVVQFILSLLFLFVGNRFTTRRSLGGVLGILREIWRASLGLSAAGVLRLTYEPMTKLFMSIDGSLSALASFDLALRISTNVRGLFQSAIQPLLVIGSRTTERMDTEVWSLYSRSNIRVYKLSLLFTAAQFAGAPMLSQLAFGAIDLNFMLFFSCLVVANALNTTGIVGYYFQLSSGDVRPLVIIQAVMVVINLIFGYLGGAMFGSPGIVAAYGVTFAYGGMAGLKLWLNYTSESFIEFFSRHTDMRAGIAVFMCFALTLLLTWKMQYLHGVAATLVVYLVPLAASGAIGLLLLRETFLMRQGGNA